MQIFFSFETKYISFGDYKYRYYETKKKKKKLKIPFNPIWILNSTI